MSLGTILRQRRESLSMTQDQVSAQVGISKPYLSNIETAKVKNPPTDPVLEALERVLQFEHGELMKVAHLERTPMDIRQEHETLAAENNKYRSILQSLISQGGGKSLGDMNLEALAAELGQGSNLRQIGAGAIVPIINRVAAGYPAEFTDLDYPPSVADDYIRCPGLHDEQAFAARVVGDSMLPEYCEGDVVVFSPNKVAEPGDDCFVRFTDDSSTTFKRVYQDDADTVRLQPLNPQFPAKTYSREQINGLWPAVYRIQQVSRGR